MVAKGAAYSVLLHSVSAQKTIPNEEHNQIFPEVLNWETTFCFSRAQRQIQT